MPDAAPDPRGELRHAILSRERAREDLRAARAASMRAATLLSIARDEAAKFGDVDAEIEDYKKAQVKRSAKAVAAGGYPGDVLTEELPLDLQKRREQGAILQRKVNHCLATHAELLSQETEAETALKKREDWVKLEAASVIAAHLAKCGRDLHQTRRRLVQLYLQATRLSALSIFIDGQQRQLVLDAATRLEIDLAGAALAGTPNGAFEKFATPITLPGRDKLFAALLENADAELPE